MDFTFSAEQDALRGAVRAFMRAEAPKEYVRQMAEHDAAGFTPEVWSKIVELGWTGLLVPEAQGGLGLGLIDAVVVQEEMGRAVFPGPFFSSAIAATLAARALGIDDRLEALAAGSERGTIALDEAGTGDPIERTHLRATGRGARHRINGVKPLVLDGGTADWVLVPARTREGLQTLLVEQPRALAKPAPSLDITRKFSRLEFDDTRAVLVGPPGDHAHIWRRIADDLAVMLAAELIGVSEAAQDLALDYAQAREVFGKPLSKFQVTRHKAVDMLREIEIARVNLHYAAWASDTDAPDREIAAAMAKAQAASAANYVTAECIQIHGGVGYTWENDSHIYLRRAKVNDLLCGAQGWQRERVADEYFATL
ncbi:MAG TPA: acyl-CoA dehydrogenase family protein [Acidimicrobiia bacterium]|nr:acyl-CoA dehydrogenase family protein [Acidimicrobiia bacterium]